MEEYDRRVTVVRGLTVALVSVGCGRIGFEPGVEPMEPMPVPGVNSPGASDEDPTLSGDQLELYFASNRPGGLGSYDIYFTTRQSLADAWAPPLAVAGVNTPFHDAGPELSADGLALYFHRFAAGGEQDVFVVTRASRQAPWSAPAPVPGLDTPGRNDGTPTVTADQLWAAVARSVATIYASSRAGQGDAWSVPVELVELSSLVPDLAPHVDAAGTRILFASDRAGSRDLWTAVRASRTEPFTALQPIDAVNTTDWESDPWLSPDGRTLYFKRGLTDPQNDLYFAVIELP
jgi:Tol biopolymer transport system component